MNRTTHSLAGICLAEAYILYRGVPLEIVSFTDPATVAALVPGCIAAWVGSLFPDMDVHIGPKKRDVWGNIHPSRFHRTLFHWWPLYLIGAYFTWAYRQDAALMFFLGALGHLFLDFLTMMGIPLKGPFGRKSGLRIVRVGSIGELPYMGLLALGVAGLWLV